MNVLFLTQYDMNGPSSRVRVYQFAPLLKARGIQCDIRPLVTGPVKEMLNTLLTSESSWARAKVCLHIVGRFAARYRDVLSARNYDVVVIQKDVLPFGLFHLLMLVNRRVVYEFDDAIWEPSPNSNGKSLVLKLIFSYRRRLFLRLLRRAAVVIAENSYLADFAHRYNAAVEVISAPVDTEKYRPQEAREDDTVVLGWLGSPMTSYLLERLREPLTAVSRAVPGVAFHNIAGNPVEFPGVRVTNIPWSEEQEVAYLSRFDVGLMPLDDSEFNKGRLGYKMLIYASMGLPIVADDVGLNREVVTNGVNGYLVSGSEEWAEKLTLLARDGALRARMGSAGRERAVHSYDLRICADILVRAIERAARHWHG
ncbi:MAG TPA: glycosyltransferase family 4 protein [Candidatus Paceibacterota bacterium]